MGKVKSAESTFPFIVIATIGLFLAIVGLVTAISDAFFGLDISVYVLGIDVPENRIGMYDLIIELSTFFIGTAICTFASNKLDKLAGDRESKLREEA